MPASIKYITEEHCSFVEGTFTYLALGIFGGGAAKGIEEGWHRQGGWGLVFKKVGLN